MERTVVEFVRAPSTFTIIEKFAGASTGCLLSGTLQRKWWLFQCWQTLLSGGISRWNSSSEKGAFRHGAGMLSPGDDLRFVLRLTPSIFCADPIRGCSLKSMPGPLVCCPPHPFSILHLYNFGLTLSIWCFILNHTSTWYLLLLIIGDFVPYTPFLSHMPKFERSAYHGIWSFIFFWTRALGFGLCSGSCFTILGKLFTLSEHHFCSTWKWF